jgi:hypothetical protein
MTASSVYGQAWRQIGAARDAGVGSGAVWIVGKDDGILHYEGAGWVKKEGAATAVAPGPGGALWVVNVGDMNFQAQAPAVVVPTPSIPAITQNTVVPIQPIPVIRQPTQTLTVDNPGATIIVSQGIAPAASTAPPAKPIDPKGPWIVFPRGGIYEAKILKAIRFQCFAPGCSGEGSGRELLVAAGARVCRYCAYGNGGRV